MRKKVMALVLVLVFALGITAQAVDVFAVRVTPSLTFNGTTATCAVTVNGDSSTDAIVVTAKLYQGGTLLKTWTKSGTGTVKLSETATVTRTRSYILESTVTINGVKQTVAPIMKACP